ncbi:dnaJ homolog subfamily C member 13-like [Ornithodoros turicata]|uniref:dnaJ homolog subfamily C member 13-like n=1 Tax=Ornithodoros turicata TaxID=34597 RepID=UPI003139CB13
MATDMLQNEDLVSYLVTKSSWRGRYPRVFSVGSKGIRTYEPHTMEITNQWPYCEFAGIFPNNKGSNQEYYIRVHKGKKIETMRFIFEHRAEILTEALKMKHLFSDSKQESVRFNAMKHHWSEQTVPVILEVTEISVNQIDGQTGRLLACYYYKDVVGLSSVSDCPGGLAIITDSIDRIHVFATDKREAIMKKIVDNAIMYVGVQISFRDVLTLEKAMQGRLGRFSTDEAVTSLCEFTVHKISQRHKEPVKRILGLTECCLVERDASTYTIATLRPLADICRIVRSKENPQQFSIEYVKGQIRHYISSNRDALLATLLDGVRSSGNRDVHVAMVPGARGQRFGPLWLPVEEDVEATHLRFLHTKPPMQPNWTNADLISRFNSNVPYSGLLHTANKDGFFSENKEKFFQNALLAMLDREGDQGSIPPQDLEAQFQALRRLFACKIGFAAFTQVPRVREHIGMKVVTALKRNDPAVTHSAIDMLCALMQPMHDNGNLYQEQLNKTSLLSRPEFLKSLMEMFVKHVEQGTGALVVSAMLDLLTFAMCYPYSETTEGGQFDSLLDLVASHGRVIFQLFQHPSVAIVKGAGMVMRAIIEEGDFEIARRMQDLALAEAALPRHLHMSLYSTEPTLAAESRLVALQHLARHLAGLWVTGHEGAMAALKRMLPPGLLASLESKEKPPESRNLISVRDNLQLAFDHSNKTQSKAAQQWKVVERHVEHFLQHWKARIYPHQNDEKNQQRPIVLRKRRQRIKSEVNWPMFYYQFHQDHARPDLIWNFKTREELKDALEAELRAFSQDRELCRGLPVSWNHWEFEVQYPSLSEEIRVGDYFLRLLLEEESDVSGDAASYIRRSTEFFNDLYHRFLLATKVDMRCQCLQAMALVYGRHHDEIGPFNDTRFVVTMLDKCTNRLERDRLLVFISKLILNKKNVKILVDTDGVKILVDFVTLAHLHTNRAVIPTQINVIEASPEMMVGTEKEWYYDKGEQDRHGPYSFAEMKELWEENKLSAKTRCWAQGMDGWRTLDSIPQLKWGLLASGAALMNDSDLAAHILSMLITICEYYPSKDPEGAVIRPLPRAKRKLSDPSVLPHIVQVLLTFDPVLVEKVAVLLMHVMQHNPAIQRLYTTGFFFFVLLYTGSNLLNIGQLLHSSHTVQAFRLEEGSTLTQRSVLGQILPEAMVCYLENHGATKFAEIFLGEFDTPEAIWNSEMRRFMMEKIACHIADFTPRLKSNTRCTYQYCPIPAVRYPQLEHELFCNIYYLRHLCDTQRFPNWPVADPVQLLKDVLESWRQELDKKPPSLSIEEACQNLGITTDERMDDTKIRHAYFKLAQKYHPDKNPDGREIFEKVNRSYEFLSDKSQRRADGPDPVNLILILKTQAILFSNHREELHPYKYAGYPMLIKMMETEVEDDQLLSKEHPLLGVATETAYHTLNCSELNVEELRREGGLEVLQQAFSRCVAILSQSSKPSSLETLVLKHVALCFGVAAKFPACREVIIGMPSMIRDLCRVLYFKHLPELCLCVVSCISALSVDEELQTQLFRAGALFHLMLFFFQYDYTLEEGGVERTKENNQQEVANQLAQQSMVACARLGGLLDGEMATPPNHMVRESLQALFTLYLTRKISVLTPAEVLKVVTGNTENPYLIWDNSTRAELQEYLKAQQRSMVRSGECDESFGVDFTYSVYSKELIVGEIFIRIYNEQPTFPLENPRSFVLDLLNFIGTQAQYLHSARSLKEDPSAPQQQSNSTERFWQTEKCLEALHNVIRNHAGVEVLCIGHFRLLFCLLSLDGCSNLQSVTVNVIQAVTGNKECVNDIASAEVLVYLLLVLMTFTSQERQVAVLDTLLPMMSNSKLVKEAINKGAVVYLLEQFCNSCNPLVRERTGELLSKMSADKLQGRRLSLALGRFLPEVFLDAMRQSPQEAVHLFEGNQENPELIWNNEAREQLCNTVKRMSKEQYELQKTNPDATWKLPPDFNMNEMDNSELVIGGVYIRLFVQNPAWSLRRPQDFLSECLYNICSLMTKSPVDETTLDLLTQAVLGVLQSQPLLRDRLPEMGHFPQLVTALSNPQTAPFSLQLLHEVAHSQVCVQALCQTDCMSAVGQALRACPEMGEVACKALNTLFDPDRHCPALVNQALKGGLVEQLLQLLGLPTTSATTKAHIVQTLKSMATDLGSGDQVNILLGQSKVWSDYKDQKHDLFVTPTAAAGYLPSATGIAGYLTQGSTKQYPHSPPPLGES